MNAHGDFRAVAAALGLDEKQITVGGGLVVESPCTGARLASIAVTDAASVAAKVKAAVAATTKWRTQPRAVREAFIDALSQAVRAQREALGALITHEGGKTLKEGMGEAEGSADVLAKTIKDSALPELGGMLRVKEREPAGVVALITSFNFPLAVANWTIAPALLAGNAVIWKPSEKTPLTALAYEKIFAEVAAAFPMVPPGLFGVVVGDAEVGSALVGSESVDMVSATGSVAMGRAIKSVLAKKKNNNVPPILELGGNNAVVISDRNDPAMIDRALDALLQSVLGTAGQRCTNTRRLIVYETIYSRVIEGLKKRFQDFIASGMITNPLASEPNAYGYGPLIDAQALERFEWAKQQVVIEGGRIHFGARLALDGIYVEPALAEMPSHTQVMRHEIFAPLLFVAPCKPDIKAALAAVNLPENAGLVNGIYTQDAREAEHFSLHNQAGHSVINSPRGTGTPANGMGFGGQRASGEGEILNTADPLRAFCKPEGTVRRIARDASVPLDWPA